jgi:hypothetical protein
MAHGVKKTALTPARRFPPPWSVEEQAAHGLNVHHHLPALRTRGH